MAFYVVLAIALVGGIIYGVIVLLEVPGLADERLGRLEPLPSKLNAWVVDRESAAGKAALERGELRETRIWKDPQGGFLGRERLWLQARCRNPGNNEIVGVEPDVRYRRHRIRS